MPCRLADHLPTGVPARCSAERFGAIFQAANLDSETVDPPLRARSCVRSTCREGVVNARKGIAPVCLESIVLTKQSRTLMVDLLIHQVTVLPLPFSPSIHSFFWQSARLQIKQRLHGDDVRLCLSIRAIFSHNHLIQRFSRSARWRTLFL